MRNDDRFETRFVYKGWMGLVLRYLGTIFEFVIGRGDSRLSVTGETVKECEKKAKALIDRNN
jgi:hypothetical protein